RKLERQKLLSLINISGLSVGLACFTLLVLYSLNEFQFDRFHENAANIYRVYQQSATLEGNGVKYDVNLPVPLGPALRQDFPDVLEAIRFMETGDERFVRLSSADIRREKLTYADPSFFSVFSFKFIRGNAKTALQDIRNIVVTEEKAKTLFGHIDVIGKTIEIQIEDRFELFTIAAVTENVPSNSSIGFGVLGNLSFLESTKKGRSDVNDWESFSLQTFVLLRPKSSLVDNTKLLAGFREKYYAQYDKKKSYSNPDSKPQTTYGLQSLTDIHVNSKLPGVTVESVPSSNILTVLGIAGIILFIACINFTTLAIGRMAGRAKEVGVRKFIGGQRSQLMGQFLSESVLLTVISAVLSAPIVWYLLPYFNQLSGRHLVFTFSLYPQLFWIIAMIVVLTGFLAGSYPAFILSGFNTLDVLRRKIHLGGSNLFTKMLVTFQFAVSIGFIIATLVILQQIEYMASKDPGFRKDNIIVINASETDSRKIYPVFKQALLTNTNVVGLAGAEFGLGKGEITTFTSFIEHGKERRFSEYYIDHDYINVLKIQMVVGRNFEPDIAQDTSASIIINEAMMNHFGWTLEDVIGQRIKSYGENKIPVVIGVIKNFNFRPLDTEVTPQMFHSFAGHSPNRIFVRVRPGNPSSAISEIEKAWKKLVPDYPLYYSFLDEGIENFYTSEKRWGNLAAWAGGISIFLACLGLFGLAALSSANRTKEVCIRKIMGASTADSVLLLTKDFLKLILLALLLASPAMGFIMSKWLSNYAYRIEMSWQVFVLTGAATISIGWLTVCIHAIKGAVVNPVDSLRSE
ncbi:MAG: ABC transporter permease, partial [Cyclobacteriaceae bacterium]|nr:ABC transporter permease [Cyclobacteriaceae bacterium]